MLKLLIFAPCEKIIEGRDDVASLISVLESVQLHAPAEMPPDALAPMRWGVMTLWKREEEVDGEITFEQRTDVLRPDGTVASGGLTVFTVSNKHVNYRNRLELPFMPIGQEGEVIVRTRLRQSNPETEWRDIADYPIIIIHHPEELDEKPAFDAAEV